MKKPMPPDLAKYSCDECRVRKIRCSREVPGCSQCKADARECIYSRSGVIRRRRTRQTLKREHHSPLKGSTTPDTTSIASDRNGHALVAEEEPRSQMDYDLNGAQDNIRQYGEIEGDASGTLATLYAEYSSFWQGPSLRDMAIELGLEDRRFVGFKEEETSRFVALCTRVQVKGTPLFAPTPPDIMIRSLRQPNLVLERAHLAYVYGVLLTEACLDDSFDQTTITKFRWNLRLSLDDAKLLLEPSDLHISILTLLAFHVQELSTPSLSWMLISTACRMLQILGVNGRKLDPDVRDRRIRLYWTLNAFDKSLALVFGRSPSLHGAMYASVPLIPVQKLLDYTPHITEEDAKQTPHFTSMFGAYFIRQIHLSSGVASDIWSYLYTKHPDVGTVRKRLDDFYHEARKVLDACFLTETAFLSPAAIESMRLGLKNLEFQYHYHKVLINRSEPSLRTECVATSREALFLLNDLVSDTNEVFNGVIWLLLYSPFTPFFVLFGEVLSAATAAAGRVGNGNVSANSSTKKSIEAMAAFVEFLSQMRPKHPQAPKLHTIAATFLRYARSAVERSRRKRGQSLESGNPQQARSAQDEQFMPSATSANPLEDSSISQSNGIDPTMTNLHNSKVSSSSSSMPSTSQQTQASQPLLDLFSDPSVQDLSLDVNFWFPQQSQTAGQDGFGQQGSGEESMQQVLQTGLCNDIIGDDAYGFFVDANPDWFAWADGSFG